MALFSCTVNVYRAGAWKFIHSKDLVPGDIMHLDNPTGVIPCDAILLSGDCIINESMLTGESIPVSKIPATKEEVQELQSKKEINSRSFLFCGTKIIRVRAPVVNNESPVLSAPVAIVVRTGFDTMKGGLLRSMMFPKPHDFQFYRDSFLFIGVLSGIGKFINFF